MNFGVIVYLIWSGIFISMEFPALVVLAKLVILGTLFLTSFILALRAVFEDKLVILGISFLTSFILALRVVSS